METIEKQENKTLESKKLNENEIRIGSSIIEIREITIEQILDSWELFSTQKDQRLPDLLSRILNQVTSIDMAFLKKLKPSEIARIIEAIKKKNNGFFQIAASLGAEDIVQETVKQFKEVVRVEIMKIFKEQRQN